jgi:formate dehydrogenase iron-sulfur subunit
MAVTRREFLKRTAGAALGGLVLAEGLTAPVKAAVEPPADSMAMLYDATVCVGCRACQNACKARADRPLPPDSRPGDIYELPADLSAKNWTLIKLYQSQDQKDFSYVKVNCMHCLEPACASACLVGALEKTPAGPVVYHTDICLGCRYCMIACPYHIPRYQWDSTVPFIQKCDFCAARQAQGQAPACTAACPTGALIYGKRTTLLAEAKGRIAKTPTRYVDHVYGEHEAGGASALYLSAVPFEKLGLPTLRETSLPSVSWPYMVSVPFTVVVVGSLMTAIYSLNHRKDKKGKE